MPLDQKIFAVITALALLGLISWLVMKRKLREEYALLWLLVGGSVLVLSMWYGLLEWLTGVIGAVWPTTTLFIFSLLFLLVLGLHFSVVNSRLKDQIRDLTQEMALLRRDLEKHAEKGSEPIDREKS